jgi:vacuolar-type H+-ATPase subunit I/STV1
MKKVIIASSIAALGVTGLAGGAVFATANSTSGTDPMSGLVSAIATKFNLKKDNVQKVFDEQRTQMETQREQEVKDQVAQLVKDGKLTQAQADKINAKRAELVKEREANRTSEQNLTDAQRKTRMEERKTTLDTWLKDNNIDSQYVYLLMGGHGGRGGPDGGKRDSRSSSSQSSTSSTSSNN